MFLYFIPGASGQLPPEKAKEVGIGYALTGKGVIPGQCGRGPDGGPGILCAIEGAPHPNPIYAPADQTWVKGPGGKYWAGFNNAQRPTPDLLARDKFIAGDKVKLRDGHEWTIPIARSFVRGSALPQELSLGEDGRTWELKTLPEYVSLCADAEKVWEGFGAVAAGGKFEIDDQELIRIAVDALGVNYRVSAVEVSMLRLLSTAEMWLILRAMVDWNSVIKAAEAAQKKE